MQTRTRCESEDVEAVQRHNGSQAGSSMSYPTIPPTPNSPGEAGCSGREMGAGPDMLELLHHHVSHAYTEESDFDVGRPGDKTG